VLDGIPAEQAQTIRDEVDRLNDRIHALLTEQRYDRAEREKARLHVDAARAALAERDALLKDLLAALKEAREWIYEDVQANDPNDRDETARLRAISLSLRTRIDSLLNREVGL
jgi:hypothetical protein